MIKEVIKSKDNKKYKWLKKLNLKKYSEKANLYPIYNPEIVKECILNRRAEYLITTDLNHHYDQSIYLSKELMSELCGEETFVLIKKKEASFTNDSIICLDELRDPLNMAAIINTMIDYGYQNLLISNNSCDYLNEKTSSLLKKEFLQLRIKDKADLLKELNELANEYVIISSALNKDTIALNDFKIRDKFILVLGNEAKGVSEKILKLSSYSVKIEMANIDSLNVALAANILMSKLKL